MSLTSDSSAAGPPTWMSKPGSIGCGSVRRRGRRSTLRGAGRDEVDDGEPGWRAGPGRGADHAVGRRRRRRATPRRRDRRHRPPAMTVTGSVPRAGKRSDSASAVARTSEERGSVRASPFSKRALRKGTPSRTSSRPAAPPTQRPALHPTGQPVEAAVDIGDGTRRLDPPADRGQRRGQQRDRGGHGQQHDGEAGDAERREERHAEHEQSGHGHGDREGREDHRRPRRGDGGDHRVVDLETAASLLAEPVDHQQAVVDAQADAEHVHDVDREDRHVAEGGGADEDGEGREHPADGDEQRHAGRRPVRRAGTP